MLHLKINLRLNLLFLHAENTEYHTPTWRRKWLPENLGGSKPYMITFFRLGITDTHLKLKPCQHITFINILAIYTHIAKQDELPKKHKQEELPHKRSILYGEGRTMGY